MKKKSLLFLPSLIVVVFCAFETDAQSYDQLKVQLQFENYYGTRLKSNSVSEISGSQYLFEDWLPMQITFAEGSTQFDQGKLDLSSSGVEVVYKGKEMFISPTNFKLVKLMGRNSWFVPGNKYFYKDVALTGIVELFKENLNPPYILQQHFVYLKVPSTNGYVSGGSTEKKLMKSTALFLHDGVKLIPIKGKQSLIKFYKADKAAFANAEKDTPVDFKDPRSLQNFIEKIEYLKKN